MGKKQSNIIQVPLDDGRSSNTLRSAIVRSFKSRTIINFLIKNTLLITFRAIFALLRKSIGINIHPDLSAIHKDMNVHIVDVGAADGFHPRWYGLGNSMRVTCFEPEESAFNALKLRYKGDERIKIYKAALSNQKATKTLYLTAWKRAAGLHKPTEFINRTFMKNLYKVTKEFSLDVIPLSDLHLSFDFIKVDTQGHELNILKGTGDAIHECLGIEVEIGLNEKIYNNKETSFIALHDYCTKKGFTLCELRNPDYWHYVLPTRRLHSKGFVSYTDAVYLRFPEDIIKLVKAGEFPKSKMYSALAIYMLYGNYEFAYTLNSYAKSENLMSEETYLRVLKLINGTSGVNKLLTYNTTRSIESYFAGYGVNDSIGF